MSRLIAILTYDAFDDFALRGKLYELRACEGRFATHIVEGAQVEFQRGYTKAPRLHGRVGEHIIRKPTIAEILRVVNYKLIEPRADSLRAAWEENWRQLGSKREYIAFEFEGQELVPADWYDRAA